MGKIVSTTYMTLDGDIANMHEWHGPYQWTEAADAQLDASDALIMGRKTYDSWSAYWPTDKSALADRMNSIGKYVVSSSLKDPSWTNTQVISDDVVTRIRELKERTERNILQYGFGDVTRLMLENGLLDELRIWLHPVLSGKAAPEDLLFREIGQRTLTLNGTEVHSSGLIILSYSPAQ